MTELKFFNTLTRKKEEFDPLNSSEVLLYTCGPTVYDFAHIGNLRTYVFEDLLRRTLEYFGFKVKQAMNLTDVDDKTIKGSNSQQKTLKEYTKAYKEAFFKDLKALNIEPAEFYPEATAYIPQMIDMIKGLLEKGVAYVGADKSVYFSISKFPAYGKLSHLKLDELKKGASERAKIATDSYDKENASDFVLWKAYDNERDKENYWESPFGKGRPGWHIECSAMVLALLGKTIDIHCGGVDNIFPHHENEIAQAESFTGQLFVRYWLHSEHLIVDSKKMSKSLKNFYTLKDLVEKGYSPRQTRLLLLQAHYHTQLNFTLDGLKAAGSTLARIDDFIGRLKQIIEEPAGTGNKEKLKAEKDKEQIYVEAFLNETQHEFEKALADDLNISKALAALFDLIREINAQCDLHKIDAQEAQMVLEFFKKIDQVLGVIEGFQSEEEKSKAKIPVEIEEALKKRNAARKSKDFKEADKLRDWIFEKGFVIEDSPKGSYLKKK